MRPSFHPRLINDPFSDPGLFIPFLFEKRALMFDLGDLSSLSSKDLLKVSHVFVTHTHMDHFIGFDTLLRTLLGRDKTLHLFGPPDFFQHVEGKLAGYTWNLVSEFIQKHIFARINFSRKRRLHQSFFPATSWKNLPFQFMASCLIIEYPVSALPSLKTSM